MLQKTLEIKKELFKNKAFNIVLFHAYGCKHCEAALHVFEQLSTEFKDIGFFAIEFTIGKNHFDLFAEKMEDLIYEPAKNEDGTPKLNERGDQIMDAMIKTDENNNVVMVNKYSFPAFYVYHDKAISEENEWGFVGGFDGNNPEEAKAIIHSIEQFNAQET